MAAHQAEASLSVSPQHGDRKGPPIPIAPPSPLLYSVGAAKPVYSSGEGGWVGPGGPLRSPCWGLCLMGGLAVAMLGACQALADAVWGTVWPCWELARLEGS